MAGLSPRSPTLRLAGERGYLPLSLYAGDRYIASQWEVYAEGAAAAGRPVPDRSILRVARDVLVGRTDKEARKNAIEGAMGYTWREYLGPDFATFNLLRNMIPDPDLPDSEITLDYLCDHAWIVGSPDTVAQKLQAFSDLTGGCGTILPYTYDYSDTPEVWRESMELLAKEVVPHVHIKESAVR
jgi:alkanesulfonate monooxygenase SsuD/methylene tetrahydromethanopterin reductase-like flavin-dependent oxidoreductase (luciferase family)